MLRDMLKLEDVAVGRKARRHADEDDRHRGALPANTSRRISAHRSIPTLLRNLTIGSPNQIWAMDTTYIPMSRGFVYLTAVLDGAGVQLRGPPLPPSKKLSELWEIRQTQVCANTNVSAGHLTRKELLHV